MTVLITRPKDQSENMVALLEKQGGKAIVFPTLEITSFKNSHLIKNYFHTFSPTDYAIFLSANAVNYCADFFPNYAIATRIIAIGTGTAKALKLQGISPHLLPSHFSSEGILQIDELKNLDKKTIAIFCGANSPSIHILKNEFKNRGARIVHEIICYEASKPHPPLYKIEKILALPINLIVSTSLKSLENLYAIFSSIHYQNWLQTIPLLVISQKMKEYAQNIGFSAPIFVAENASDEAIINELLKLNKILRMF